MNYVKTLKHIHKAGEILSVKLTFPNEANNKLFGYKKLVTSSFVDT